MTDKEYWYWLLNIEGVGLKRTRMLLEHFESPRNIYGVSEESLTKVKTISEKLANVIINSKDEDKIKRELDMVYKKDIDLVLRFEDNYPKQLNNIYDPPYGLYVRGRMPEKDQTMVAIVGSRNCTNYGKEMARYIAKRLSTTGIVVVSGMARGIDTYAHKGALESGAYTCAVLGCGVDVCYPPENIELFMNLSKNGGVISELPPGSKPRAGNFPMRNRIISGMSDAVLVVEAEEKSGSLITVDYGLEQGKDIYAVPGRADDILSHGCNNLIKMGAKMVTDVNDILEDFYDRIVKNTDNLSNNSESNIDSENCENCIKNKLGLERVEKIVYACLRLEPKHIDEITRETGLKLTDTIQILFELEDRRLVAQTTYNYYARVSDNGIMP